MKGVITVEEAKASLELIVEACSLTVVIYHHTL